MSPYNIFMVNKQELQINDEDTLDTCTVSKLRPPSNANHNQHFIHSRSFHVHLWENKTIQCSI